MRPTEGTSRVWVLAIILGLIGASCTMPKDAALIKEGELPHGQKLEASTTKETDAAAKAKLRVTYGQLPLHLTSYDLGKEAIFVYPLIQLALPASGSAIRA